MEKKKGVRDSEDVTAGCDMYDRIEAIQVTISVWVRTPECMLMG